MRFQKSSFTLIELLVVIAIITILASLLMPSLRIAKERAYLVDCKKDHNQIFLAFKLYSMDHRGYLTNDAYFYWVHPLRTITKLETYGGWEVGPWINDGGGESGSWRGLWRCPRNEQKSSTKAINHYMIGNEEVYSGVGTLVRPSKLDGPYYRTKAFPWSDPKTPPTEMRFFICDGDSTNMKGKHADGYVNNTFADGHVETFIAGRDSFNLNP